MNEVALSVLLRGRAALLARSERLTASDPQF